MGKHFVLLSAFVLGAPAFAGPPIPPSNLGSIAALNALNSQKKAVANHGAHLVQQAQADVDRFTREHAEATSALSALQNRTQPNRATDAELTAARNKVNSANQSLTDAKRRLDEAKRQQAATQAGMNGNGSALNGRKDGSSGGSSGATSPGMALAVGALGAGAAGAMIGVAMASNQNPPSNTVSLQAQQLRASIARQAAAQQSQFDQINQSANAALAAKKAGPPATSSIGSLISQATTVAPTTSYTLPAANQIVQLNTVTLH